MFYFGLVTLPFTFEQDNFYKINAQLPPIWTLLARFIFTFGAFYTDFIYVYLSKFISWWRHLVTRLCLLPLVVPPQQLETQMREMYFGLQFPFFLFCYKCPLAYTSNRQLNICTRYSGTRKHVSSILNDDFKQYTTWLTTELFQFTTLRITLFLFRTGLPSVYIYLRNFNPCLWQTCHTG